MAKKDFYAVWTYKSPEGDKDISLPNLEVINLLKSLKSSGYVKETFNWCVHMGGGCTPRLPRPADHEPPDKPHPPTPNRQYYYYYLTPEGIAYLREYLHLPADVVPSTHTKREARPARPAGFGGACIRCAVVCCAVVAWVDLYS